MNHLWRLTGNIKPQNRVVRLLLRSREYKFCNCPISARNPSRLVQLITDLTPLAALTELTDLELSENHLTDEIDFSPLLALTKLTHLSLAYNQISDRTLEIIAELTTLESLDISYNRITDISILATLPHLTHLKIVGL